MAGAGRVQGRSLAGAVTGAWQEEGTSRVERSRAERGVKLGMSWTGAKKAQVKSWEVAG